MILLKDGFVFDGFSLGAEREDLIIDDGRIAARGKELSLGDGEVFHLAGKIICPGFIDLHPHSQDTGHDSLRGPGCL